MKFKNLDPFYSQSIQGASGVLVNFGAVFCSATNSANNMFIPTVNNAPIKWFGEEGFSETNFVSTTSPNSFVCLKVVVENILDLVQEKKTQWENIVFNKNYTDFADAFQFGMNEELQQEHFNLNNEENVSSINLDDKDNLDFAQNCNFNQMVNFSPKIQNVSLISVDIEDFDVLEDDARFNFIQEEAGQYYKLVPIALVVDNNITQLINFDYCFSFPFFWLDSLKEEF